MSAMFVYIKFLAHVEICLINDERFLNPVQGCSAIELYTEAWI